MNRTVTIDELARTVARFTQCDESEALAFVREAFMLAAETLISGESVEMKSVGTFAAVDGVLCFRPDDSLSEAVNAPFAAFAAVEIPDPSILEPEPKPEPVCEPEKVEPEPEPEPESEPEPEIAPGPDEAQATEPESAPIAMPEAVEVPTVPDPPVVQPEDRGLRVSDWIMPLLLALLCLTVGFVMGRLSAPRTVVTMVAPLEKSMDSVMEEIDAEPDSMATELAAVADTPKLATQVTDTVRRGRFLTTMARQHYGQMEYWVYIYEENTPKLGHPDRIEPGTVVVIPPAEKYGLKAGDEAKIAEAKRKAVEIYKNH